MIKTEDLLELSSYHGAELGRVCWDGDILNLLFRNIILEFETDDYFSASVTVLGVKAIKRDGMLIDEIRLEGESSSVLMFERDAGKAALAIEWVCYNPSKYDYVTYEFEYASLEVVGAKQDDLIV